MDPLDSINEKLISQANPATETPIIEPVVEPVEPVEPVVEPVEPVVDTPVTEPVVDTPVTDPIVEPIVEPTADKEWSSEDPLIEEGTSVADEGELITSLSDKFKLEFNKDETKNIDSVLSKIESKIEDGVSDYLEGIPDQLKKAVELAKEGVDYQDYLNVNKVNYDDFSDVDLYANSVSDYFTNDKGEVDSDALQSHIDALSDVDIKIKGDQVRKSLNSAQEQATQKIINDSNQRKADSEKGISKALEGFDEVEGFKVSQFQKEQIKSSVVNDSIVNDFFYSEGKLDFDKVAEMSFLKNNFKSIIKFLKTKSTNDGKRAVIQTMTNPEVVASSSPVLEGVASATLSPQQAMIKEIQESYK